MIMSITKGETKETGNGSRQEVGLILWSKRKIIMGKVTHTGMKQNLAKLLASK